MLPKFLFHCVMHTYQSLTIQVNLTRVTSQSPLLQLPHHPAQTWTHKRKMTCRALFQIQQMHQVEGAMTLWSTILMAEWMILTVHWMGSDKTSKHTLKNGFQVDYTSCFTDLLGLFLNMEIKLLHDIYAQILEYLDSCKHANSRLPASYPERITIRV